MGNLVTKWWWGGNPDAPNPVSGLTPRQVREVQTTWTRMYAHALTNGLELFKRLFRADSETKHFFKNFRNMSEQELVNSPQFKAHALTFMHTVNMAVANLKSPDMVVAMMDKLGENHSKRRAQPKHFHMARDCLLGILKDDMHLNDYQMKAWSTFTEFIQTHIFVQLKADVK